MCVSVWCVALPEAAYELMICGQLSVPDNFYLKNYEFFIKIVADIP